MASERDQKANYTLDEMMSAARGGGSGGSGGRRRRSRQPMLEARKKRRRVVGIVLGLCSLTVLAVAGFLFVLRGKLSGELFRQSVSRTFAEMTNTEVTCGRFGALGLTDLACGSIDFKKKTGIFRSANLLKLEALMPVGNLWSPEWVINSLRIQSADLLLVPKQLGDGKPAATVPAIAAPGASLGISAAPTHITVNGIGISRLSVRLPEGRGGDYSFEDMTASGSYLEGVLRLDCQGGTLTGSIFPRMTVRSMIIIAKDDLVTIESCIIAITPQCDVHITGKVEMTEAGPAVDLDYQLRPSLLLEDVFSATWSNRLAGKVFVNDGKYAWKPGQNEEISGNFELRGAVFKGFPANAALTKFMGSEAYTQFEFRQMGGTFRRFPDRLELTNLSGNLEGQNRISGGLTSYDTGRLNGDLKLVVNIPEKEPPGVEQVDGLEQFRVQLSGTHDAPQDGVAEQLGLPAEN